jgi:uncharacterized membrane protein
MADRTSAAQTPGLALGVMGGHLERLGPALFLIGLTSLGLISVVTGEFLKPIQPVPGSLDAWSWAARLAGAMVLSASLLALVQPNRFAALAAVAAMLVLWTVAAHLPKVLSAPGSVVARVAAAELLAMSAVALWLAAMRAPTAPQAKVWQGRMAWCLRLCVGLMLLVFGSTHWLYREAIASMVPAWLPAREMWPWVTGGVQIAVGLATWAGAVGRLGLWAIGAMYCAWLPIVHAARLMDKPTATSEWTFAAMAVVLIGVVWTGSAALRSFERHPREV